MTPLFHTPPHQSPLLTKDRRGYAFLDKKKNPFIALGGAYLDVGERELRHFNNNFMPTIETIESQGVAAQLVNNGHNTYKIYLPPNNLGPYDAIHLKNKIKEIYHSRGLRAVIIHFGGLYATKYGKFLFEDPSEDNLNAIDDLVKGFAEWMSDMGDSVAFVQLSNENDYYVKGASPTFFGADPSGDESWKNINLAPEAYYSFMHRLAQTYKATDPTHAVFLGNGLLTPNHVGLLQGNIDAYDGVAVNIYPNWNKGRDANARSSILSVSQIEDFLQSQIEVVTALDKPLAIGEWGESSHGIGDKKQCAFMKNFILAASKFTYGSKSDFGNIVALIMHEYLGETWKDRDIDPSESELSLFTKNYKPKMAFSTVSQGYLDIQRACRKVSLS